MLERSPDPDTLSNRVVHVSVQLFSNENLALHMTEQLNLLHVMVVSLKYMMSKILIQNTLHGKFSRTEVSDRNVDGLSCRSGEELPLRGGLRPAGDEGPLLLAAGVRFKQRAVA